MRCILRYVLAPPSPQFDDIFATYSQIVSGTDPELRGFACFTRARCVLATEGEGEHSRYFVVSSLLLLMNCNLHIDINKAVVYLRQAQDDFRMLEMYKQVEDAQYLEAVVWNNIEGGTEERNKAAQRHQQTVAMRRKIQAEANEQWVCDVWDLVADIGAGLSHR